MGLSESLSAGTYSSSFADDTRIWRGVTTTEDCSVLQDDLQSVYSWADNINMTFNSDKFEWLRYVSMNQVPDFYYQCPDTSAIV